MKSHIGTFTLSLDCEGLWGMADEPAVVGADVINQAALADAYDFIKSVLGRNELRATAAFVTCFAAGPGVVQDEIRLLRELAGLNPGWRQSTVHQIL